MCEKLLILRLTQRDININIHMSLCKVPVILVELIKKNFNLPTDFRKILNSGGNRDRQADMTKLIVAFRNFMKSA
jgi:hypothetical protein